MRLKLLFSRQTWHALDATTGRKIGTWMALLVPGAVGLLWPTLVPWWGWILTNVALVVGLALLGRYWVDRDLRLTEPKKE